MSEAVYAQGATASHQWAFRGPRVLTDPAAGATAWAQAYRAGMQALAGQMKQDAQAAYSDVPVIRDGFAYDTQISPYPRLQLTNRSDRFPLVEYQTRPHVITAKNAPYLVFPIDGHWVRVKSVNHPGTRGRYAIDPIFARNEAAWRALGEQAVEAMLAV